LVGKQKIAEAEFFHPNCWRGAGTLSAFKTTEFLPALALGTRQMAHLDFGRVFPAPDNNLPSAPASAGRPQSDSVPAGSAEDKRAKFFTTARFDRAEWMNVMFMAVTFIGGLFCAFYLFNGSEVWRAAASWTRDLLHSRPAASMAAVDVEQVETGMDANQDLPTVADHSGDPFSGTSGFLSLAPPSSVRLSGVGAGLPTTAIGSVARAVFAQLGFAVPGGDALKQEFDRAVADLSRTPSTEAVPTVAVVEPTSVKAQKHSSARPKHHAKRENVIRNSHQRRRTAAEPGVLRENGLNSAANFSTSTAQVVNSTSSILPPANVTGSATSSTPISLGGRH
jgi:hypothetical protein